ncbi:MAG: Ig-like domain-containing protein [Candidatus Sulfotelmatobacter sp.]
MITAALGGITSTAVTLTVQAKTVTSIVVSPITATTYTTDTQQFSATATYNDGSTASVTGTATWTTTPTGIATISSSGLATGVAAGSTTITAAIGTITGTASLTVQTKELTSITVAPANPNVAESGTLQFGATGTYNDGSTGNVTSSVAWYVDHVKGGNPTDGTITTAGLYMAPSSSGTETITATSPTNSAITASATVTVANAPQGAVLTYHNDDARDGAYTQEFTLMPSNVNSTTFGKLYAYPVNGQIMAQPLYMPQMSIGGGTYDVVFVVTENNYVYAFNADATSSATAQTFWQDPLGAAVLKTPNVYAGIQSTPVIDPSTNTIYLVAEKTGYSNPFWLYALNAATGVNQPGSPVNITATYNGDSLESSCDQRVGLALDPVSNAVYIGFGDCTHGWVVAYDKTTLAQTVVFDDTNEAEGGGLWSSGGAPAIDDTTGDLYLLTGTDAGDQAAINNTNFTQIGYNNSFLRLAATDLSVLDYFSPDNSWTLAENDADLASGGNVIMPASSAYPLETIGGGKDGNIYVVNRSNMGGFNATNNVIQTIKTGSGKGNDVYDNIFDTPVYWNGSLYFHCNDDVIRAYSWSATTGLISTSPTSVGSNVYGMHGATASLSANGTLNGIVWDIDNTAFSGSNPAGGGPSVLHAYNATDVATELYNSTQAGSRDTAGAASKFTAPTIAGGKVFVPTSVELDIYGLLP